MPLLKDIAKGFLKDIRLFSKYVLKRPLYAYQLEPAKAILDSILHKRGLEFAILFPRQAGKNETQAHLEAYLLTLYQQIPGAAIVKGQPTYDPQALNALRRLEDRLGNDWTGDAFTKTGNIVRLGQALITFFSAQPTASIVGATASLLLEGDEAQDIPEYIWGKRFEPMTASTNATTALFGTAWTNNTLLAKTIRRLQALEAVDYIKRVFIVTPEQVGKENPRYLKFVSKQIAKYGREHPFVKTQLFNETIDAEGGMFPPPRRAMLHGSHPALTEPIPGELYAAVLDVAGEDEAVTGDIAQAEALANPKRDSTVLKIARVNLAATPPTYEIVFNQEWIGTKHTTLHAQIAALLKFWRAVYIVADATGVGAGLVSFLAPIFGDRLLPFVFTGQSKSKLGWNYLALADTGRLKMYADDDPASRTYREQLEHCQYQIIPGPGQLMRWGVPDGTRNLSTGLVVHDDHLTSEALFSELDELPWPIFNSSPTLMVHRIDPLDEINGY